MKDIKQKFSSQTVQWLIQRQKPGNWYDISENDVIPVDIVGPMRSILHMFQIAFSPEIRQRLNSGKLEQGFTLSVVQLIQPLNDKPIIRLNEEARGIGIFQVARPVQEGEPIYFSNLRKLESFDLEVDELNAGHFTLLWNDNGWFCSFDFRSGRAMSANLLDSAREFLETAQYARDQGNARACVDNLFSACELACKARLILQDGPIANVKSHQPIHSKINLWGHLGNVDELFLKLFNLLSNRRSTARYNVGNQIALPSKSDLEIAKYEIEQLRQAVRQSMDCANFEQKAKAIRIKN